MEERTLGRSGLTVPAVGMGTWRTFDVRGAAAEEQARTIVAEALRAGARFIDSSPMYGQAERVSPRRRAYPGHRECPDDATPADVL